MTGDVVPSDIKLRNVRRQFADLVVLDAFDLTLEAGTVTALRGPNGSGKTTVARLVLGLDAPDAGSVEGHQGRLRAAVFQENRLFAHLSPLANVRLVLDRSDWTSAEEHLRLVGLTGATILTPVGKLSGGQRRRVAIVRALAGTADLVVLDEPYAGLDVEGKPAVQEYVRERVTGRTTLLITHDSDEAAWLGAREVRMP